MTTRPGAREPGCPLPWAGSRGSGSAPPASRWAPAAEREQRPQHFRMVGVPGQVLTRKAPGSLTMEPAVLVDPAVLELALEAGPERTAKPLGEWNPKCHLLPSRTASMAALARARGGRDASPHLTGALSSRPTRQTPRARAQGTARASRATRACVERSAFASTSSASQIVASSRIRYPARDSSARWIRLTRPAAGEARRYCSSLGPSRVSRCPSREPATHSRWAEAAVSAATAAASRPARGDLAPAPRSAGPSTAALPPRGSRESQR